MCRGPTNHIGCDAHPALDFWKISMLLSTNVAGKLESISIFIRSFTFLFIIEKYRKLYLSVRCTCLLKSSGAVFLGQILYKTYVYKEIFCFISFPLFLRTKLNKSFELYELYRQYLLSYDYVKEIVNLLPLENLCILILNFYFYFQNVVVYIRNCW